MWCKSLTEGAYIFNFYIANADAGLRRMRAMPTFGQDKIRRFWKDVSSRKQIAARDYEDFLIVGRACSRLFMCTNQHV